ncbi:hypothetical protein [Symbioplanes lichenis]|uniref:hypothetical protein n=1 Tax=Symbioplanes lichenis TaxID=1629072 RepID=UPI002738C675|nr:hypothetical protein [Actinoplanes lichenis]
MTTPQPPEQPAPLFSPQQAWPAPAAGAPATGTDPVVAPAGPLGTPVTDPAEPRPRRKLSPLLLAATAGALAGALVVGAVWLGTALDADGSAPSADNDARAACDIFDRVPDTWQQETFTQANTARLQAGIALAVAAAEDDARYRALAAEAQRAQQALVGLQLDGIATQVRAARSRCDDL